MKHSLQDKWERRGMFTAEAQIQLAGQYITQLKKEKGELRTECNRLYGIGQDYDADNASARAIMQRFVDKVDSGRARSTETYAEMKQWMEDEDETE